MPDSLLSHLNNLRLLFAEAAPEHPKVIADYAWTIVKALIQHTDEFDSFSARQLLAECIRLPLEHPSIVYSALLGAAIKIERSHPDFRFATFLKMWGIENLRIEDKQRVFDKDGKSCPSLEERMIKALAHSLLLHSGDESEYESLIRGWGYSINHMLVTRIREVNGGDGRRFKFVTLTSREGIEVEMIVQSLAPSPLHSLPNGKRHYANIGQLYDVLLKVKSSSDVMPSKSYAVLAAYVSSLKITEVFPTEIGYVESVDQHHAHMHVYDTHSRHFVAPILRFSREKAGDFVLFVPIVPLASKFKTAIIQTIISAQSEDIQKVFCEIRITGILMDKGYASWELSDKSCPIIEQLSSYQLSLGETSPSFTCGYLNITKDGRPQVPNSFVTGVLAVGQTFRAYIYLRRGKNRQKRPHVAFLFTQNF